MRSRTGTKAFGMDQALETGPLVAVLETPRRRPEQVQGRSAASPPVDLGSSGDLSLECESGETTMHARRRESRYALDSMTVI
jgi:hypothetical protein